MNSLLHPTWSFFVRRVFAAALLLLLTPCGLLAQFKEAVILSPIKTGGRPSRYSGQIIEYTGANLLLRTSSGREIEIPAARVVSIDAAWSPSHQRGDQLLEQGRSNEALDEYRKAFKEETRPWVQRRVLSRSIWCFRNNGQIERAGSLFQRLLSQDETTPYFDCIPLTWRPHQGSPSLLQTADQWLNADQAAVRLMGASWLLNSPQRARAVSMFERLTNNSDRRIALLAAAQQWRAAAPIQDVSELNLRRKLIQSMPVELRAGPYYLLGRDSGRLRRNEEAALALMRAPILYPYDRELSAYAMFEAARNLEKLKRLHEARGLYYEITAKYNESSAAAAAKQRLTELASPK